MARVNDGSHSFTCYPHVYFAATERHRALWPVLIFRPAERRRLSWFPWLVTNVGGLPARRRSPIPVLTGPGVE